MTKARAVTAAGRTAIFLVLCVVGLTFLYPIFFMGMNSLKTRPGYYTDPFRLPVRPLQWQNFSAMVSQFRILQLFRNTGIICLATLVLLVLLGVLASYS